MRNKRRGLDPKCPENPSAFAVHSNINDYMKVYLDNNVLVDIEDGKNNLSDFITIQHVEYYYSEAHLNELLEASSNPKVSQNGRLELINKLCGNNLILAGVLNPPEFYSKSPVDMYHIVNTPFIRKINRIVSGSTDLFQSIRQQLGFDSKSFNNVKPEDVLPMLDARMREIFHVDLIQYLSLSEGDAGRPLFCTLLNIIDTANYWADKNTSHSNIARLNDASHAYFAQICDVLVTNDKRMITKVKAIYAFLGIRTSVMNVHDFLKSNIV